MKRKLTVTVGIPAYNEQANIANLLNGVLAQRGDFTVEKIIVANDASSDQTADIVKNFSKKDKRIILLDNKKREGKLARLNDIYEKCESDILVTLDADLTLLKTTVIENLTNKLNSEVELVGGNFLPLMTRSFVGKMCKAWDELWFNIRSDYKGGDNIYNSSGAAFALKKGLFKTFRYPKRTVADQQIIYFAVKNLGKKFCFAKDAEVYYKTPDNFSDYLRQSSRWLNERKYVEPQYPHMSQEYVLPWSLKIKAIIKSLFRKPLLTMLVLAFQVVLRFLPANFGKSDNNGVWKIATSTKSTLSEDEHFKERYTFRLKRIIMWALYKIGYLVGFNKKTVSILCYHNISDGEERYTISPTKFRQQIERILFYADFISLDEAVELVKYQKKVIRPQVVLTFDDGYRGVLNALDVTKKYKIPVAVFVLSRPRFANRLELDNNSPLLSQAELRMLHDKEGWIVGCHSSTHPDLTKLSKKKLYEEVINSKRILEKCLKSNVSYFAYPKGKYNSEIIELVRGAGYKAAFSIQPGSLTWASSRWLLPRTVIESTHHLSEFPAVFSPTSFLVRKLTDRFRIWDRFLNHA